MDPGIGTPGADEVHRVTLETLQDGFQLALYRFFIRLVLPAEKAGAVVGDNKFIIFLHKMPLRFYYNHSRNGGA